MQMINDAFLFLQPVSTIIGAFVLFVLLCWLVVFLFSWPVRHCILAWTFCRCIYLVEAVHGAENGMIKESVRKKYPRFYKLNTCWQIWTNRKLVRTFWHSSELTSEFHTINLRHTFPRITVRGKKVEQTDS